MALFNFGKKKEEKVVTACYCGSIETNDEENSCCCGEGETSIKVIADVEKLLRKVGF